MQLGLVASLNRPGGNVTGITTVSAELETKRLGLLRELVPSATSIAVLVNPMRPGVDAQLAQVQQAARALGLTLHILNANSGRDLDVAFVTLVQLKAGALIIADGPRPLARFVLRRGRRGHWPRPLMPRCGHRKLGGRAPVLTRRLPIPCWIGAH